MSFDLRLVITELHDGRLITDDAYNAAYAFAPIAEYFWPDCTVFIHGKDSVIFHREKDGRAQYATVSKNWISFLESNKDGITLRQENHVSICPSHDQQDESK